MVATATAWRLPGSVCVLVAGYGEGGGLAGRVDERDEVRAGDLAHVESREDRIREVDEPV